MVKKLSVILGGAALLGLCWFLWVRATGGPADPRRPLSPAPLFDVQYKTPGERSRVAAQAEVQDQTVVSRPIRPTGPTVVQREDASRTPTTTEGVFSAGRRKYQWKPDHWVVPRSQYRESLGEKVAQDSLYVFYRTENPPPSAKAVVATVPGGTLKVATGRLRLGFKPGQLDALIQEFSLEPQRVFEDLGSGYFTVTGSNFDQLVQVVEALKKDKRVTLAQVEIMESRPTAQ